MKLRYFILFSILFAMQGCSSSTTPNPALFDFSMPNSEFQNNVSDIDAITTLYNTAWNGVDIVWKDSTGKHDSLANYAGKVILLSFWRTTDADSYAEESTLDSAKMDLGDSVVIVSVSADQTFQTVTDFVAAHNIKHQVVLDSLQRAQTRYAGSGQLAFPETFALQANGNVLGNQFEEGWASLSQLDSLVRAAYK